MELNRYAMDVGLTNVLSIDTTTRAMLPTGPARLLPSDAPINSALQQLLSEQGLDVYLLTAFGQSASGSARAGSAAVDADAQAFATPKDFGEALDHARDGLARKLAVRDETDPAAKLMRAAHRVLTSAAEMRAELGMYRGLLLAG